MAMQPLEDSVFHREFQLSSVRGFKKSCNLFSSILFLSLFSDMLPDVPEVNFSRFPSYV